MIVLIKLVAVCLNAHMFLIFGIIHYYYNDLAKSIMYNYTLDLALYM